MLLPFILEFFKVYFIFKSLHKHQENFISKHVFFTWERILKDSCMCVSVSMYVLKFLKVPTYIQ